MDELLKVLKQAVPKVDWTQEGNLLEEGKIDSIDIITIVSEITAAYGIEIPTEEMEADNFTSAGSILAMLERIGA